ncbi:50S ribosomal protein L22 [Candidatus Woesearchaeota archaeon]|nr:50S ribosomal protein L22 [Candidatus Woesearchaeota archaeon]
MANQKYAAKDFDAEHMARAKGMSLPISVKKSVEICNLIRFKNLQKAKDILSQIMLKKMPVPLKKFNRGVAHKKGNIAGGSYPIKASKEILGVLKSAESNAQFKGIDTSSTIIKHICAHKARKQPHYGRMRGRTMKRTHIEIILEEKAGKKTKKRYQNQPKKEKTKPKKEQKSKTQEKEGDKKEPQKELKKKTEEKKQNKEQSKEKTDNQDKKKKEPKKQEGNKKS